MKKQNITKPKPYYVPAAIQKLFTFTAVTVYVVQAAFIALSTLTQFQQGSDYRPQLGYFVVYNLVPIVVFLLAYILNPRQLTVMSKAFEAVLISIAAYIGWSFVGMLLPMFLLGNVDISDFRLYEYFSSALFVVMYVFVLIVLRKNGTWS